MFHDRKNCKSGLTNMNATGILNLMISFTLSDWPRAFLNGTPSTICFLVSTGGRV